MTNNDDLALKPVGNLFKSDKGEVLFSPSKWPVAGFQFAGSVYSADQVNALLAERDADKKRIAELESRTVSVKLPESSVGEAGDFISHAEVVSLRDLRNLCDRDGIKLEVGE